MIPINRNSVDPFYRYKMPPLNVNKEGKQGNPRTNINNFLSVADSLKRKPELIRQFFIYQLSGQIKLTNKLTLNGEFTVDMLQNILYNFIDLLIICRHCENPETSIKITNDSKIFDESSDDEIEKIYLECYACGKKTKVNSPNKIISYILKNPEVIEFDCYNNEKKNNLNIEFDENLISNEKELFQLFLNTENKKDFFNLFLQKIIEKKKILNLIYLKEILKDDSAKNDFFACLEENIVSKDLFQNIGEISSYLCKFLKKSDFSYFKSKSKVVSKKESLRIRNILENHIEFRDN